MSNPQGYLSHRRSVSLITGRPFLKKEKGLPVLKIKLMRNGRARTTLIHKDKKHLIGIVPIKTLNLQEEK